MSESIRARIPWVRLLLEGAVIVGSILLAFGIDAWWDERQERKDEARSLAALAQDFGESRQAVGRTIERTTAVQDTVLRLLELMSGDLASISPEELNGLVSGSFWYHRLEPTLSTYQDMVNSGDIRLIQSDSLRLAMAAFVEDVAGVQNNVRELSERWATLEEPYLVEHFVIADLYQGYRGARYPDTPFHVEREAIRTREFANILAGRVIIMRDIIENAGLLLEWLDTIDVLIQRARSDR